MCTNTRGECRKSESVRSWSHDLRRGVWEWSETLQFPFLRCRSLSFSSLASSSHALSASGSTAIGLAKKNKNDEPRAFFLFYLLIYT